MTVAFLPLELNFAFRSLGGTGSQESSACATSGVEQGYSVNVWVSFLMTRVDDSVATRQSHSSSAVVAMHFPAHLCRFPYLIQGLNVPGPYSGLAFGCQKSCLCTGFPKAFSSPHHRLSWRWLSRSQVVSWIRCRGFCNRLVYSRTWLLAQCPIPKPGGPVGLVSEFSFSWMDCRPRLTSSIHPWFRIRVFLLLDKLPTKAIELHLPRFWDQSCPSLRLCRFMAPYSVLLRCNPPKGRAPLSATRGTHLYVV